MQRGSFAYFILGFVLLSGCTKGIPEISALQSKIDLPPSDTPVDDQPSIPGPTFGGLPTGSATVLSIIQPLTVAGECSPQFTGLEVSIDNGATWLQAPTAGSELDCSDSYFTISISNPSSFFAIPTNTPATQNLLVRGLVQSEFSGTSEFVLNYDPPKISVTNINVIENSGPAVLTLNLDKASPESISVLYTTSNSTAMSGSDFTVTSGTLTFAPGETSKTVTVNILLDSLYENDENFFLDLSGSTNASIFVSQASVTIENDDPMPTISLALATLVVSESDSTAQVSVNLSSASAVDVIFSWNTSDFGATAGNDYTASSGSTTITAGATSVLISVPIVNDPNLESSSNEKFKINLTGATNASLGAMNLTTVTITSDDVPVVEPAYPLAPNWNDYVRRLDTNTLCDGSEAGDYFSCIHGGERKKVIVTGQSSCTNLSLGEGLGALDWECKDISGVATFYSKGIKDGKGLRDLINATGSWLNNSVTIISSGHSIGTSSSSPWWSNPTIDLATMDNSDGSATIKYLTTTGAVYYIASDRTTFGYQIATDKISVVSLGSYKFVYRSDTDVPNCETADGTDTSPGASDPRAIFCGGTKKFIWLEVAAEGYVAFTLGPNTGVLAYDWKFSRIHNSKFSIGFNGISTVHYGLNLINSSKNLITGLDVYRYPAGVQLIGTSSTPSSNNIFRNLNIASTLEDDPGHFSLKINMYSHNNRFYETRVSNHSVNTVSTDAVRVSGDFNIFSRINISNVNVDSSGSGLHIDSSASNNIFTQVVTTGVPNTGILINGADNNIFSFFTAANNSSNGVYLTGSNTENNFVNSAAMVNIGSYALASSSAPAYTSTSGNHFSNLDYSSSVGIYNVDDVSSTFDGFVFSIATDFVRKAASDSSNGAVDRSYSVLSAGTGQFLWSAFDSFFRNWGKSAPGGVTFTDSAYYGNCTTGEICSIWDWRVASGSPLHNTSILGGSTNPAFTTGTCIPGLKGDAADIIAGPGGIKLLKNAIEIDGDRSSIDGPFIGNENGLCESGENCIYAPNIGAYQGEGTLSNSFCTTDGSEVNGAKIFTYPITGI